MSQLLLMVLNGNFHITLFSSNFFLDLCYCLLSHLFFFTREIVHIYGIQPIQVLS